MLAAAWGAGQATPIIGAGHAAAHWQEAIVTAVLALFGAASLLNIGIIIFGLRGRD